MLEKIIEQYSDETFLKADGFDEAIIGACEDFNTPVRLIYSVQKCLDILMNDMSYEEALEYFDFNISGANVGDKTPIWCIDNL